MHTRQQRLTNADMVRRPPKLADIEKYEKADGVKVIDFEFVFKLVRRCTVAINNLYRYGK